MYYFSVTTDEENKRLIIYRNHALDLENYIVADATTQKVFFLTADDATMVVRRTFNLVFMKEGQVICCTKAMGSFGHACSHEVWWADRCLKDYVSRYLLKIW